MRKKKRRDLELRVRCSNFSLACVRCSNFSLASAFDFHRQKKYQTTGEPHRYTRRNPLEEAELPRIWRPFDFSQKPLDRHGRFSIKLLIARLKKRSRSHIEFSRSVERLTKLQGSVA